MSRIEFRNWKTNDVSLVVADESATETDWPLRINDQNLSLDEARQLSRFLRSFVRKNRGRRSVRV